ncbi:MAG: hypothetical protein M0P94_02555 [Candidatus Absconditabacterales bacterium]|nr:hypothetical protein [Candidatus Absconditabacterales bacterium]
MNGKNCNDFGAQRFRNLVRLADGQSQLETEGVSLQKTVELMEVLLDKKIDGNTPISELQKYAQEVLETLTYCKEGIEKIRKEYK